MKRLMMTKGNYKYIFKQITSLLISICIIGQSSSTFAMQTPKQQRAEFIEYLKEEQDRYKTLFDQEALLEVLDYDTDNIIDFVSNKVVYQAYDGVLRGAKGTLIGRAGNSHDQAITLAGMLNDAGLEAEILVGKLTAEQATELNLTIASPQFKPLKDTITSSKSIVAKQMFEKAEEIVKTEGETISTIMKKTDAIAERIFQQLPKEQIKKGMEAFKKNVQSSAISYRWVRYRLAQGKEWFEVHPAYVGAKKWNLIPLSFEKKSVNPDDLQQFSVEVWIENSAGEKHSISGLWKKPAANLLNHTLSIDIASDAMMKTDLSNQTEEMLKKSHYFFVQVDGKSPKDGKAFDLHGNIYSGDSLSGLNSIFSTLNKKTQKVADALSSLSFNNKPEVNSKKQLTKVWLEFILDKPNTKSRYIKRVIFDDNALEDTGKTAMRLLQRWDINVGTTTPMSQYYQYDKTKGIIKKIEGFQKFQQFYENEPNASQEKILNMYDLAMSNPNHSLLMHKRSIFDMYEYKNTVSSYLSEPNILAMRHGYNSSEKGLMVYETTDIVSNQRWSFLHHMEDFSLALLSGIHRGVWDTHVEGSRIIEYQNQINTTSAFENLASTQKYSIKMISDRLNLFDNKRSAWWDIDSQTGTTVGMMYLDHGIAGVDTSEEMILQIQLSISTIFLAGGTRSCAMEGRDLACCLAVNTASAIAGAGIGSVLAKSFANAAVITQYYLKIGSSAAIDGGFFASPVSKMCNKI